jgi:hypothetical protein
MAVWRATIRGSYSDGTLVETALHYRTIPPIGGDEPDPNDTAAGIWGFIGTQYTDWLDPDLTVHDLVLTEEVLPGEVPRGGSHVVNQPGDADTSDAPLPRAVTMVMNKRTGTHTRSGRGWLAYPFQPDGSHVDGNRWNDAALADIAGLMDRLSSSFTEGEALETTVQPCVYSRTRALAGEDPVFFDITSVTANARVHWLRSRATTP